MTDLIAFSQMATGFHNTDQTIQEHATNNMQTSSRLSRSNPSLQVTAQRTVKLVPNTPIPSLENHPHHVLLHIRATGICGSDLHLWKDGHIGHVVTVNSDYPLGHEASGVVLECGSAVTDFRPGDRVAVEPGVSCGDCFACNSGHYNLCASQALAGAYPHAGTLQRYYVHPAKYLHKIPDSVSFAQASLLEPLSVVLHALNGVDIKIGRGVAICGAGPIGLISLAAARASGAHPIVITDVEPKRLRFAEEFVPGCRPYLVEKAKDAAGNARAVTYLFGADDASAPPVVLECTGIESSVCTACYIAKIRGTVMVIGIGPSTINNLPLMHLNTGEVSRRMRKQRSQRHLSDRCVIQIQLRFSNKFRDTWPAGISALSGGILNLDKLVTHVFDLEDAVQAFELAGDVTRGSIKVHIVDNAGI